MKQLLASLAAVAALGIGSAALAQTPAPGSAMHGDAMHGDAMKGDAMHGDAMKPLMVCRPANAGETASAKMADGTGIVCKKIDTAMMMKGPQTPDTTPARMEDKAWLKMLEQYMYVQGN
jgi:pentapeptide MXKDX repeat protein